MSDATISPSNPSNPSAGGPFRPPTLEELGAALPQYEFVALIGAGGMGAVYKARQPQLNRFVAIKILPPMPGDEMGFAERFRREAQSLAQLSHPHIVAVHDFGETAGGLLYFVMEYVEGADLRPADRAGAADARSFLRVDSAGLRRAAVRARSRHRASRHQAGEHPDRSRRAG